MRMPSSRKRLVVLVRVLEFGGELNCGYQMMYSTPPRMSKVFCATIHALARSLRRVVSRGQTESHEREECA
jgi:hypothetical protein